MSTSLVFLVYAFAFGLALLLIYLFKPLAWYWHILSCAAALAIGLMPPRAGWQGPAFDLVYGFVFIFLMVWGIGGVAMYRSRQPRKRHA